MIRSAQTSLYHSMETQTSVVRMPPRRAADVPGDRSLRRFVCDLVRQRLERFRRPERLRSGDAHVHAELRAPMRYVPAMLSARLRGSRTPPRRAASARARESSGSRRGFGSGATRRSARCTRHAGPLGELAGDALPEAAVLDRVVHAAEHARRVLHRLLVAQVRAARADVRDVRSARRRRPRTRSASSSSPRR